jgi:hypothetical protein
MKFSGTYKPLSYADWLNLLHNLNVLKTKTHSYSSNRAIAQVSAQNDIIISMDMYFNVLSPEYRTET